MLVAHLGVAAERVAYAGVFGLAVLAVVASRRDLSVGIVGAFLLAIAALVLSGSGNLFDAVHPVPPGGWGTAVMAHRFWGGRYLLYHPNSLACIGVLAALRIGPDRTFAVWQRAFAVGLAAAVVYVTNSRTGFVFAVAGALVHAVLLCRRRGRDLPPYRRAWLAAAVPFAALVVVLVVAESAGQGFLLQGRYSADDPTSGRTATWKQVGVEWLHAGWAEQTFGDAQTTRAVVKRAGLDLTTDNAAVGALRRGGVLGELAFLFGLALLLWHAIRGPRTGAAGRRRAPPAWLTVAVVAMLPTIATADWPLGGTGGTLWILFTAGEAWLVLHPANAGAKTRDSTPALQHVHSLSRVSKGFRG